jgi:hypothetical protein
VQDTEHAHGVNLQFEVCVQGRTIAEVSMLLLGAYLGWAGRARLITERHVQVSSQLDEVVESV